MNIEKLQAYMKKTKKADKKLNKRSVRKIESKQTWDDVKTARP